jgi:hypothetical protein
MAASISSLSFGEWGINVMFHLGCLCDKAMRLEKDVRRGAGVAMTEKLQSP